MFQGFSARQVRGLQHGVSVCQSPSMIRQPSGTEFTVSARTTPRRAPLPRAACPGVCVLNEPDAQADLVADMANALHSAQQRPQEALTQIFQSPALAEKVSSNFAIDHCGLLLKCEDSSPLLSSLEQQGFLTLQCFPSRVLSKVISDSLQKPVSIEIVKLARGKQKIELFLVESGMTTDEIASECSSRSHLAVVPRTTKKAALHAFVDSMVHSGLKLVGSGINDQEQSQNAAGQSMMGVTVLYFQTLSAWNGTISKLELCVPGVDRALLHDATSFP